MVRDSRRRYCCAPNNACNSSVCKGACGLADCVAHLAQRVGVSHAAFHVLPRLPQFPALWLSQTHGTYTSSRLKHGLCRGSQDVSYVLSPRYIDSDMGGRTGSTTNKIFRSIVAWRAKGTPVLLTRLGACLKRKQSRERQPCSRASFDPKCQHAQVQSRHAGIHKMVPRRLSLKIVPRCDLALGTRSRPKCLKRAAARMRGLCHLPRSLMRSHFPRDLVKFSAPATEQGVLLQDPQWFGANTRDIILVLTVKALAPRYRTPRTRTRYLQSERPTNLELTQ
jgi:hypothetical protein